MRFKKKWRNWQRGKSSHLLFRRFHIYCNKTKSPKKGKETQSGKRRDKSRTHLMNYNANWVASKMLRSNAALACVEFIPGLSDESSRTPFFLAGWVWVVSEREGEYWRVRGEENTSTRGPEQEDWDSWDLNKAMSRLVFLVLQSY